MSKQKITMIVFAVVLLAISIYQTVHNIRTDDYITRTEHRDTAQEKCAREIRDFIVAWKEVRTQIDPLYVEKETLNNTINMYRRNSAEVPPELYDNMLVISERLIDKHSELITLFAAHKMPDCK